MAPIEPALSHKEVHACAKSLSVRLAARDPKRYTTIAGASNRIGKLFIDYCATAAASRRLVPIRQGHATV
jgi:bifunctional non-homologous end joining protein LigD